MAQHNRIRRHSQITSHRIGVTDTGGNDFYQHLVGFRSGQGHLFDGKGFALGVCYCSLNLHI